MPGSPRAFTSVHTDSREVRPGGLFFALKGAETDGHRFLADAVRNGATGVVVSEPVGVDGAEVFRVADTWEALYDLAAARLAEVKPLVVGITGSNGKTSTKEMVAAVLASRFGVLKTEGNLNTETGVPLTLLRLQPGEHQVAVLEMGMQGAGEIRRLAQLARPRVGVVTGIGSVHIEFFADGKEGIARAKGELLEALPEDGLAVLNADDPFTDRVLRKLSRARVVTFGLDGGDYRGLDYASGSFKVGGVQVRLQQPGRHQARNALAALAVGEFAGVPSSQGARALGQVRSVEHRLQALPAPGGFIVVDDVYNASPESMLAAFETLAEARDGGRLLAVLGEMRELGEHADAEHRRVAEAAANVFDEVCVVAGGFAGVLAEAAGASLVPDKPAAVRWVHEHARPGDRVLVKASHGVALEDVVQALLRPQPSAGSL